MLISLRVLMALVIRDFLSSLNRGSGQAAKQRQWVGVTGTGLRTLSTAPAPTDGARMGTAGAVVLHTCGEPGQASRATQEATMSPAPPNQSHAGFSLSAASAAGAGRGAHNLSYTAPASHPALSPPTGLSDWSVQLRMMHKEERGLGLPLPL